MPQEVILAAKLQIDCELPNSSLYTFTGNLILDGKTLPLSPNQLLLRGCMLRNTAHVFGVVIFTGHETKVADSAFLTILPIYRTERLCILVANGLNFLDAPRLACGTGLLRLSWQVLGFRSPHKQL